MALIAGGVHGAALTRLALRLSGCRAGDNFSIWLACYPIFSFTWLARGGDPGEFFPLLLSLATLLAVSYGGAVVQLSLVVPPDGKLACVNLVHVHCFGLKVGYAVTFLAGQGTV